MATAPATCWTGGSPSAGRFSTATSPPGSPTSTEPSRSSERTPRPTPRRPKRCVSSSTPPVSASFTRPSGWVHRAAVFTIRTISSPWKPARMAGPGRRSRCSAAPAARRRRWRWTPNNDGLGDGQQLSATMRDFTVVLPTANTLGLRVRCVSNTGGERLVVDKISVSGSANLPDLAAYWDFNQLSTNSLAVDSRAGLAARILGGAAQTSDAAGRSGLPGDRAMRFRHRRSAPACRRPRMPGISPGWRRRTRCR